MLRLGPALTAFLAALALLVAGLLRRPDPTNSPADIDPDQRAYTQTCSTCHPPYDPRTHNKSDWRAVVTSMHQRANDREVKIAPETLEAAIRYLEQHGR